EVLQKADPYAFATEHPPRTASVIFRSEHEWSDADWLERRRASEPHAQPLSIYEVHLGSWRLNPLEGDRPLTYLELADELAAYAVRLAGRLPRVRRPAARPRARRDPRLGAGALPARRVRARSLRRHGAVRACRPAPRRTSRLGDARLQPRPARGAELPPRQR